MKCIDFEATIKTSLTPAEEQHLQSCPTCRLLWEEKALERAVSASAPDPAPGGITIPDNLITNEFWSQVEEHFSGATTLSEKIIRHLELRFPKNETVVRKLKAIAEKISAGPYPLAENFDHRFITALGFFSDEEAKKLGKAEIERKLKEKLLHKQEGDGGTGH